MTTLAHSLLLWRDRHGLRPRARLSVSRLLDALARAATSLRTMRARMIFHFRALSPESVLWALIALVALLFVLTLFTFSRAIAP